MTTTPFRCERRSRCEGNVVAAGASALNQLLERHSDALMRRTENRPLPSGRLLPGERIVLVVVSSKHRGDSFAACEFIMDYLKTQATFWKKEESQDSECWVEAKLSDDEAADRWRC